LAGYKRAAIVADDDEQFDTQTLIRLTAWGVSAVICVAMLVLAARTDLGAQRLSAGLIAIATPPGESDSIATGQLLARTANAEREARRAVETAITLSGDRERMAMRVNTLEHDIGDLTGSVHRALTIAAESKTSSLLPSMTSTALLMPSKSSTAPGWGPPADEIVTYPPVPVVAKAAARTSEPTPVTVKIVERPPEPAMAAEPLAIAMNNVPIPLPRPAPLAAAQANSPQQPSAIVAVREEPATPTPKQEAAATPKPDETPAITTASVSTPETPIKAELGADLGPALSMGRLRSRWTKLTVERPDLVKGMRPLVMVREIGPGKPVEIRLVVGPIANINAATEFCAILAPAQYLCRPAVFDGQRLTVQ
jgi:hypothetical protein